MGSGTSWGVICNKDFLVTHGKAGACLHYTGATLAPRRFILVSDGFVHEHAKLYELLQQILARRGAKWREVTSRAVFAEKCAECRSGLDCIGLGTDAEANMVSLKHMFTATRLVDAFQRIHAAQNTRRRDERTHDSV